MSSEAGPSSDVPPVDPAPPASTAGPATKPGPGEAWYNRETRRVSDPARAQQLWDAIVAVRQQKQIPAIVRMSRYMNRFYQVKKGESGRIHDTIADTYAHALSLCLSDATQRLLDSAVEDNLIKLEKKVGTKGHKSGIEERAYRLPTSDMLPRERHDWYCFHCHAGGEVLLCEGCQRVYHESCLKAEVAAAAGLREGDEEEEEEEAHEEDERDRTEWFCLYCKASQRAALEAANATGPGSSKKARKDLNHLLRILCNKLRNRLPERILHREPPQIVDKQKKVVDPGGGVGGGSDAAATKTEDEGGNSGGDGQDGDEATILKRQEKDDAWRASFLLKSQVHGNKLAIVIPFLEDRTFPLYVCVKVFFFGTLPERLVV